MIEYFEKQKNNTMKKIYLALLTIPFFFSCEDAMFEKDLASTDPMTNFEYLWTQCDEKYSYFELKNIDWDKSPSWEKDTETPSVEMGLE